MALTRKSACSVIHDCRSGGYRVRSARTVFDLGNDSEAVVPELLIERHRLETSRCRRSARTMPVRPQLTDQRLDLRPTANGVDSTKPHLRVSKAFSMDTTSVRATSSRSAQFVGPCSRPAGARDRRRRSRPQSQKNELDHRDTIGKNYLSNRLLVLVN